MPFLLPKSGIDSLAGWSRLVMALVSFVEIWSSLRTVWLFFLSLLFCPRGATRSFRESLRVARSVLEEQP